MMLDSFGAGEADDADVFGDLGGNTFAHIAEECDLGRANGDNLRSGPLHIPNMAALGLVQLGIDAMKPSHVKSGKFPLTSPCVLSGAYGYANELSKGKDTPSGHWEIMGVPVLFEWGYLPKSYPSMPADLKEALMVTASLKGILGDKHSSGTEILDELGEEHMRTGMPIIYTSADSVLQIACHEETYGLEKLMELCEIARVLVNDMNIGRVIARPFTGDKAGSFVRTGNRRDLSVLPPAPTVLDQQKAAGGEVISIGKISDIYAHQGITQKFKAHGNDVIFDVTLDQVKNSADNAIIFANFVDFDSLYGHRRDVAGYAAALESFDKRLPEVIKELRGDDIVILTADHGCDPTWTGSDHTREFIPIVVFGPKIKSVNLGKRSTFADIGASIAEHMGLGAPEYGTSFYKDIKKVKV
jgi:phosphopentomutase